MRCSSGEDILYPKLKKSVTLRHLSRAPPKELFVSTTHLESSRLEMKNVIQGVTGWVCCPHWFFNQHWKSSSFLFDSYFPCLPFISLEGFVYVFSRCPSCCIKRWIKILQTLFTPFKGDSISMETSKKMTTTFSLKVPFSLKECEASVMLTKSYWQTQTTFQRLLLWALTLFRSWFKNWYRDDDEMEWLNERRGRWWI